MNEERDKFLTQAMGYRFIEVIPGFEISLERFPEFGKETFSEWEWFGLLWEWAQKQEWWINALELWDCSHGYMISFRLIHPDRFADALYQFLKERS